jgi:nucleotide-binding universal stress UspA family protein
VHIVVAYAPTPEGEAALKSSIMEARLSGAELTIVRVLLSPRGENTAAARDHARKVQAERDALGDVATALREDGLDVDARTLVIGHPTTVAEAVLDVARELDAACLVIGIRRRSPVGKIVLGSDAQDLLLEADCPVLAVKAPS